MLHQAGIEGTVLLEFVIKQDGTVDSSSLSVLESTNRAFEGPARAVIEGSLYTPGEVDGGPVRVLVSQRIGFTLQATAAQKRSFVVRRILGISDTILVYIDGVRMERTKTALAELNPDAIARIEVIKGAAAMKLYGEQSADGVIQIYTKKAIDSTRLKPVRERN